MYCISHPPLPVGKYGTRGAGGLRFCNVARAVIRSAWTSPKYRGRKFCVLCARSVTIAAKNRTLMRRNCAQFRSCVSKLTQLQKQFTQFENAASRKRSFECTSSSNNTFLLHFQYYGNASLIKSCSFHGKINDKLTMTMARFPCL